MSYLKTATRRIMERISLRELADQMKRYADANPFHPGVDDIFKYGKWIQVDSSKLKITLTRTIVGRRQFYQFSMGHESGNPADIPSVVVQKVIGVFMPDGISMPSALGNTYQWIEHASNS